jgi:hypothetical protein
MQPSNFDELTKALASSTSRRQALRTILGVSIGGLLGIGGISTAFGRHHRRTTDCNRPGGQKGNSNCAKWCHAVFGPNTPAAGQCTSDAAHGRGLCRQCGSVDPSSICCNRNGSGYCDGTVAGATCCAAGQHCENATCVANCAAAAATCSVNGDCCSGNCCDGFCCDSGRQCLSNGTCAKPCEAGCGPFPCGCPSGRDFCGNLPLQGSCGSDDDCARGELCNFLVNICEVAC